MADGLAGGAGRKCRNQLQNERRRGAFSRDHLQQIYLVVEEEIAEEPPAVLVDQSCEGEASPSSVSSVMLDSRVMCRGMSSPRAFRSFSAPSLPASTSYSSPK